MSSLRHGVYWFTRRACGLLGALAAAGALLLVVAPAASAHAALLFTSPAADSAVPVSPAVLTLTFDEPVTTAGPPVTLTGTAGRRVVLGLAGQSGGRSVVTVPVEGRLSAGVYTVAWQVISADGDPVSAQYEFAVGPAPASLGSAAASAQPSTPGQWPLAAARWLLFAGLAMALGGLAGRALARLYRQAPAMPLPSPWALRGSLLGLAAGVVLAVLQLGGGSLSAGLADLSVPRLLSSGPGVIAAVEVASFAVAAVLLRLRRPAWAVGPLLAVVGAEGIRGHPESIVPVGGALLTWAHLLAVTLWAGMLLYVVRAGIAWRACPAAARALVRLYSRAAAWLFALVVATGLVSALVLVPLGSLFTTGYGWVLVVKVVLVATAAALALAGRRRLRQRPAPEGGPALATRSEAGMLAGVLAAAGLLTALPAPAAPVQALPFPPPASGPVVPVGGRAGEVGIYGTASAGQIVLHLAAPQDSGSQEQQIPAALTLASPGGPLHALTARGCGPGCLVAPVRWVTGDNLLALHVTPVGAVGGTATAEIPWPPASGDQLLRRVAAVLRATPGMTLDELVTSDTAFGPGRAYATRLTGSQFLATEPYASGVAAVAVLAPAAGGQVRLLLGFPADGIWAGLTLGAGDHIVAETLTDPDHLITRRFRYPGTGGVR